MSITINHQTNDISAPGGSVTINGQTITNSMVSQTAKASTSGTTVDFTGIPTWAKRVVILFSGVSTSGTSRVLVRVGTTSGYDATGYSSEASWGPSAGQYVTETTGFTLDSTSVGTTDLRHGSLTLENITGNNWISRSQIYTENQNLVTVGAGNRTLSAALERVRITTVNGTDTFDAGTINIIYEGGGVGGTLDSLTDVNAPTPSNGQALVWNSTTSNWEAQTVSGGGGITTGKAIAMAIVFS